MSRRTITLAESRDRPLAPIRCERRLVYTLHPPRTGCGVPDYPHGPVPVTMPAVLWRRGPVHIVRSVAL